MKSYRQSPLAGLSRSLFNGLSRWELVLVAVVLAAGIAARLVALSRSAVEHFDEGVYASNVFFPPPEYAYPAQRFYAPPLVPVIIETSMTAGMLVGAPANLAALLPGVIAGCATIVALWLVGRSWFSPRVGIAAAALAATSPFHIVYSAAALTDVWLGLWLLLAVDAAVRSLAYCDLRWAVAAGLYTGLAWWTKYNGWLPLAIEGAGLGVLVAVNWLQRDNAEIIGPDGTAHGSLSRVEASVSDTHRSRNRRRTAARGHQQAAVEPRESEKHDRYRWLWTALGCFAMTSVVALLVWSPYWLALQKFGGYGPIAGNHAKYVVGFSGWLTSAARQVAGFSVIEQRLTAAGIMAAFVLAAVAGTAGARSGFEAPLTKNLMWPIFGGALIVGVSLFTAPLLSLVSLSAVGLVVIVWRFWKARRVTPSTPQSLVGASLLLSWWVGLFVATPCYWPYPRLLLPWLLAAWLAIGLLVDQLCENWQKRASRGQLSVEPTKTGPPFCWKWGWNAAALGLLLVTLPLAAWCRPAVGITKQMAANRLGVESVARQMYLDLKQQTPSSPADPAEDGVSRIVYVLGEPPLLFQLAAAGEALVRPVEQIPTTRALYRGQPLHTFMAFGPHAARDRAFQSAWPDQSGKWRLVGQYAYKPSTIVWLDLHSPLPSAIEQGSADHVFGLYEFQPAALPAAGESKEKSKN